MVVHKPMKNTPINVITDMYIHRQNTIKSTNELCNCKNSNIETNIIIIEIPDWEEIKMTKIY